MQVVEPDPGPPGEPEDPLPPPGETVAVVGAIVERMVATTVSWIVEVPSSD